MRFLSALMGVALLIGVSAAVPGAGLASQGNAAAAPGSASQIVYLRGYRFGFVSPTGEALGSTRESSKLNDVRDIAATPDGSEIAVLRYLSTAGADGGFYRVYVYSEGGTSAPKEVTLKHAIYPVGWSSVAISPNGRLLAISIGRNIQLVNLGSGSRRLLRALPKGSSFDSQPSFTANGRHLVISHGAHGVDRGADVYEVDLHGGHARRLTRTPRSELFPVMAPDGGHLAYLSGPAHRQHEFELEPCVPYNVVLAEADGGDPKIVGHVYNAAGRPAFSPRGNRVVFASEGRNCNGRFSLVSVEVGGGSETLLHLAGGPLLPQWTLAPAK